MPSIKEWPKRSTCQGCGGTGQMPILSGHDIVGWRQCKGGCKGRGFIETSPPRSGNNQGRRIPIQMEAVNALGK